MTARIHRYEVPVDDDWHAIDLYGEIVYVGAHTPHAVEFWAWDRRGMNAETRAFRVFETDQEVPTPVGANYIRYIGTALTTGGRFVCHLIERVG